MGNNGEQLWQEVTERVNKNRIIELSPYYSFSIDNDIKHLSFALSRYKFVSKMLENRNNVRLLELGCNYGLGTQFFSQINVCEKIVGVDFDGDAIKWANKNFSSDKVMFLEDDFLGKDYRNLIGNKNFDAIVSIDVIEHIQQCNEDNFLNTIELNLSSNGVLIIGTPNITMHPYSSTASKVGHVNLYDQKHLYQVLNKKFHNVFMFGMNDEVIHTGFYPMSCYIMAICAGKKVVTC